MSHQCANKNKNYYNIHMRGIVSMGCRNTDI